ncbi:Galactosyl T domain containing protein [Trichuris trichiura]|uniref:Hexosyltransferase n=1 Tax=Trichuris trichiura TaxID=36087 RepID=A0A077ZLI2_TRITR|nr:Galactosyl T domain containing protein [Trichuris trichiura]
MRSREEYNELSSTQTNKPKHSQTASPTRYDPKETVSNDMRIECSQVHTFPVKLLYRSNKTVSSCFRYVLLREDFCQKKYPEIFVIAIVHTGLRNFKRRSLIRKTWANSEFYKKFKLAVVFAVGEDPQHPSVQATLQREWETYEDIVQFNFTDTYHNLSLKAISWLNWAAKYCPNAKYILKVDDDVHVNTFGIMRFFRKRKALESSPKAFYCFVRRGTRVERGEEDKWYVPYEEFNETVFPRFCSGSSYSLTMPAVQPLLDSVKLTPFLWLDDVYITGLLANTANVERIKINSIYELNGEGKVFFDIPIVFVHLPGSLNKRYALWKKTLELCKTMDCYN